jgi:hypothetical protein
VKRGKLSLVLCISALSIALAGVSRGQTILKQEPAVGMLHPGERVLVDDHSCPSGTIKEMIGGSNRKYTKDVKISGLLRQRHCVARH